MLNVSQCINRLFRDSSRESSCIDVRGAYSNGTKESKSRNPLAYSRRGPANRRENLVASVQQRGIPFPWFLGIIAKQTTTEKRLLFRRSRDHSWNVSYYLECGAVALQSEALVRPRLRQR